MNLAACAGLRRTPENSVWYRAIQPSYLQTALSSDHTRMEISRFSPGKLLPSEQQYATLYFADDPLVAQFEVGAVLGTLSPGGHVPHPRQTYVTLNVKVVLREVIDLTEIATAQTSLGTNIQELTGDWQGYQLWSHLTPAQEGTGLAPTQELGMALFATGTEGVRSISAKVPWHKTLTIFTNNLRPGSSLTFSDPSGAIVHEIAA